jgi:hypothetical protein
LDEPLWHNKTAFVIRLLGDSETNRLKNLASHLNRRLDACNGKFGFRPQMGDAYIRQ